MEDGLEIRVAALFGAAARGVTLGDEQFGFLGVPGLAVGQLSGQCGRVERRLPAGEFLCLLCGLPCFRGFDGLSDDGLGRVGVLLEEGSKPVVHRRFDDTPDLAVAEFRLGLALELGVGMFDRNDGRQPFADVVAFERIV